MIIFSEILASLSPLGVGVYPQFSPAIFDLFTNICYIFPIAENKCLYLFRCNIRNIEEI